MKEYRLVTNGRSYKVQSRRVGGLSVWLWSPWKDETTDFLSREFAEQYLAELRHRENEEARPWWPVGPNQHDTGYPPLPEKLADPPNPPPPPCDVGGIQKRGI